MMRWIGAGLVGLWLTCIPLSPVAADYVTEEGPCAHKARCWSFSANVWHVEGESEALNQGRAFHLDGKEDRVTGVVHPGDQRAELVVEVWDEGYRLLRRRVVHAYKAKPFTVPLKELGSRPVHIFLYFQQGGQKACVTGQLYY
ncbi:hypothetical protein [Desmospora profundinema]|uniref:Uncharacterized protein n=1 Tax=Desmospora profundinema TaxID=1571184 RepID=A0ABU1IME0_9BACL|nr:hypothetical protein [Desmospora profundinema]MDR6225573.1 hypothetical protein [Desmospora profundinema]